MNWRILDTGPASADENMRKDEELLKNIKLDPRPVLHLYDWIFDAATYGYFIKPFDHLSFDGVQKRGLQLARRPTGGGIIFHLWDFAFSILLPSTHPALSCNTLQNYAAVNRLVISVIERFFGKKTHLHPKETKTNSFCMEGPTQYDVVLEGKKVGGAAQRRTRYGLLHQGSISLLTPSSDYLRDLLPDEKAVRMEQMSYPLLSSIQELKSARLELKKLFTEEVQATPIKCN